MKDDRRKIPRVPVFFILERLSRSGASEHEYQGVVKNITPDGLLLETNVLLNKYDELQVTFTLPTIQKTLNLEAKVRWCENKKIWSMAGLEFLDLTQEQRDIIMEYLVSLGPHV